MTVQPTRPSRTTREEEARDAMVEGGSDTGSAPIDGDDANIDRDVAEHYEEMAERGAEQEGEGRLP